ncbi:MAG TPA: hypothetical protein VFW00_04685 [Rhodocyclaceae bacterium]|nr:hypothetical protein [Rhodocyclaceae bacterium]
MPQYAVDVKRTVSNEVEKPGNDSCASRRRLIYESRKSIDDAMHALSAIESLHYCLPPLR